MFTINPLPPTSKSRRSLRDIHGIEKDCRVVLLDIKLLIGENQHVNLKDFSDEDLEPFSKIKLHRNTRQPPKDERTGKEKRIQVNHSISQFISARLDENPQKSGIFCLHDAIKTCVVPPKPLSPNEGITLRGIANLGNTCYMNCIVQVLVHMKPIQKIFLGPFPATDLKENEPTEKTQAGSLESELPQQSVMKAFRDLLLKFHYKNENRSVPCMFPVDFLLSIWKNMEQFANCKQHDAHEFLISFLDILNEEMLRYEKFPVAKICTRNRMTDAIRTMSPIDKIFMGQMQSEVTCLECGESRKNLEQFRDISLDVIGEQSQFISERRTRSNKGDFAIDLSDLLSRFTKVEHLGPENMLHCPTCNKRTISTKQLSLKSLPPVMCLHVKRFNHHLRSTRKLTTKVSFPEFLDLTPFKSDTLRRSNGLIACEGESTAINCSLLQNMENMYALFAVVDHHGSFKSGHYISYVKESSFWFECDDSNVTHVSRDEVLGSEGYLLFYKKIDSGFSNLN